MYRVYWVPGALDELTRAWLRADSVERAAITTAVEIVERKLRDDPLAQGESRDEGKRVLIERPLVVVFEVAPRFSSVRIGHVWTYRRRK